MIKMGFIKAYIKSMRLYYSFITGIAGWVGVAYYEYLANLPAGAREKTIEIIPSEEKKIVILVLLFLSWGINQIINDFLGLKEDKFRVAYLRKPFKEMLAKDGDRENGHIVGEFTLEYLAERSSVNRNGYNLNG